MARRRKTKKTEEVQIEKHEISEKQVDLTTVENIEELQTLQEVNSDDVVVSDEVQEITEQQEPKKTRSPRSPRKTKNTKDNKKQEEVKILNEKIHEKLSDKKQFDKFNHVKPDEIELKSFNGPKIKTNDEVKNSHSTFAIPGF